MKIVKKVSLKVKKPNLVDDDNPTNTQANVYGGAKLQGGGTGSGLRVQDNTGNPQAGPIRLTDRLNSFIGPMKRKK